jgi:hypothetical protein
MNFQQLDSINSNESLKSERNSNSASYQGAEAQTHAAANDAAPHQHEKRGKSTSKASTGHNTCGYCNRSQYEDAARYCHSHDLIDLTTRNGQHGKPGYLKTVWDMQAKAHELEDEEWGLALARELAETGAVGNFQEADFLKVVKDFDPGKSRGGMLPSLAWRNGWEKPGLAGEEKQEAAERQYWNASKDVLSPYLKEHGYRANPPNIRVDKHGNTFVRVQSTVLDRPDGFIKIFLDKRTGKWEKHNQCQVKGAVWAEFDVWGYDHKAYVSLLLEFPSGVNEFCIPYKTERLFIAEGLCTAMAISSSYRDEGKGLRFDDWTHAAIAVGSCHGFASVVENIMSYRRDVEIVLIADREPNGAGIRSVADLCRQYRDIKVVDPRWVADLPKVDVDDIRASDGASAVVSLVEQARTLTDAELEEILGAEKREASGHGDKEDGHDNVVQVGEARRKRQGRASGACAGKRAPEVLWEPWEQALEDEALDFLPGLVRRCLVGLASILSLGSEIELCSRIGFDPMRFCQIAGAVALQQKDRRFLVLTPSGEFRVFVATELGLGVFEALGGFYDQVRWKGLLEAVFSGGSDSQNAAAIKQCVGAIDLAFSQYVTNERQYTDIAVETDMFIEHAAMSIRDGRAYISVPHVPFDESIGLDIPERERGMILDDYRQHWPMFDEFVSLLVAARFAAARKKAYVWLRAPSDWGKGLLAGVLGQLGLINELTITELERLFSGQPCGLQMNDFRGSWVLGFNEFKCAKAELKVLEQSIRFSPKNMPVCEVQIYLKLFTSAENVESLVSDKSGVEDQFANRFSLIEPDGESIDARPLFAAGRGTYRDALAGFLARDLNRRVEAYQALGRRGAEDRGDAFLAEFHQRHGLGNSYTRLSERIPELCREFREWVIACWREAKSKMDDRDQGLKALTRDERIVWEHGKERSETDGEEACRTMGLTNPRADERLVLYLTSPDLVLRRWLENEFHQGERGKLTMKSAAFRRHLPAISRPRFGSVQIKAMLMGPVVGGLDA